MNGGARRRPVLRRQLEIKNELGLHARAATLWVQTARQFDAELAVSKAGKTVNGKSIIELMMLAAARGSQIEVVASGPDAAALLDAIEQLMEKKFHEEA
jgi:phosphotransferase system HPr (HPr) family protein